MHWATKQISFVNLPNISRNGKYKEIEIPQCTCIFTANCCLKVHNVHINSHCIRNKEFSQRGVKKLCFKTFIWVHCHRQLYYFLLKSHNWQCPYEWLDPRIFDQCLLWVKKYSDHNYQPGIVVETHFETLKNIILLIVMLLLTCSFKSVKYIKIRTHL